MVDESKDQAIVRNVFGTLSSHEQRFGQDKSSPRKKTKSSQSSSSFLQNLRGFLNKSATPSEDAVSATSTETATASSITEDVTGTDLEKAFISHQTTTEQPTPLLDPSDSSEDDLFTESSSAAPPAAPPITKQQPLESTMKAKDLLSLHTAYARHATVNAILEKHKNVFDLMKFVNGPPSPSTR